MVRETGDSVFNEEVIGKKGAVLLLIYAPWCGDCRRILPVFSRCSELPEYGEVEFLQMDIDKNPQTKKNLAVERYPTLYLFQAGRKVAEHVAELPAEEQKTLIQFMLGDLLNKDV